MQQLGKLCTLMKQSLHVHTLDSEHRLSIVISKILGQGLTER